MDWEKILSIIAGAAATAIPIILKMRADRLKAKSDAEKLAIDVKKAADKLAEDHSNQLRVDAKKLAEQLEIAADKLAKEHARQIEEKEKRHQEEKAESDKKSSVEYLVSLNREVSHKTRKIVQNYNAMRSYVMHFSNGTITDANLHLLKITFLHETVIDWGDIRIDSISKAFKETHMPEMFHAPMYRLIKEGEYYLKDVETLDTKNVHSRDYQDWLKAYKVKSTLWLPIKTSEGKVVAVLVTHWPQPTDLAGHIIAKIKDINRMIEQVYDEYKPHESKI